MPLEAPLRESAQVPKENHISILINARGESAAIRPGAHLMLHVEEGQIPLIFKKVAINKLVFQMAGVDYEYVLKKGKPVTMEGYKRLKAQGKVK
jgi:hypothetical protein